MWAAPSEFFRQCNEENNFCRGGAQAYNPLQISTENTEKRNSKSERGLDGGGGGGVGADSDKGALVQRRAIYAQ